jgi:hypothetical protein
MLLLLIDGTYEVRPRVGYMWYDIHIKFHEDWFIHSNVNCGGDY